MYISTYRLEKHIIYNINTVKLLKQKFLIHIDFLIFLVEK